MAGAVCVAKRNVGKFWNQIHLPQPFFDRRFDFPLQYVRYARYRLQFRHVVLLWSDMLSRHFCTWLFKKMVKTAQLQVVLFLTFGVVTPITGGGRKWITRMVVARAEPEDLEAIERESDFGCARCLVWGLVFEAVTVIVVLLFLAAPVLALVDRAGNSGSLHRQDSLGRDYCHYRHYSGGSATAAALRKGGHGFLGAITYA
jgi:hypothetical protein